MEPTETANRPHESAGNQGIAEPIDQAEPRPNVQDPQSASIPGEEPSGPERLASRPQVAVSSVLPAIAPPMRRGDPQKELDKVVEEKMERWRAARHKENPFGFITVAEEAEMRRRLREIEAAERGLPLRATGRALQPVQTLKTFCERKFSPKEPLIEDLLYRRDLVALAGRRRHGKTTFICNLLVALTLVLDDFLGYRIPKAVKVLAFCLEDDAGELQIKLQRMLKGQRAPEGLALYTREDFYRAETPIDVKILEFKEFVIDRCAAHRPDVIVFDNLAHLIGADYNNSKLIHELLQFAWELSSDFNAAIIIAAHPRKRDKNNKLSVMGVNSPIRLRDDQEAFFEEVMGSSHFVNSCESLWGLDRDLSNDRTDFLGGAQRFTGQQTLMTLEKDEDDWLGRVDDFTVNFPLAINTPARKKAWELLPDDPFTYTEGERAVKPAAMKSSSSFHGWFEHCKRLGVIVADGEKYKKAGSAHSEKGRGKS